MAINYVRHLEFNFESIDSKEQIIEDLINVDLDSNDRDTELFEIAERMQELNKKKKL